MSNSLLNRMVTAQSPALEVVSLLETGHYVGLARRVLEALDELAGEEALVVLDASTAGSAGGLEELVRRAGRVVCVGPDAPCVPGVEAVAWPEGVKPSERFLVLSGGAGAVALAGLAHDAPRGGHFSGAWSVHGAHVRLLLRAVLGEEAEEAPGPSSENGAVAWGRAVRVMSLHAEILARREQDALDRADLFTALDILKAISAKRRAHDILYVFTEQIAETIGCSRCSIVRVWGEESNGHVLASHEDASVVDRTIVLSKYPELAHALQIETKVVIDDVAEEALTQPYAGVLEKAGIQSLVVVPIVLFDEHIGSLLLRAARPGGGFTRREIGFLEVVCEAASNALQRAHLFESIQIANERLERLAVTDGLTGLFNHRYFIERLAKEVERTQRYKAPLSCMLIDVDNFKQLNDTYGHLIGDSVLREIAGCCGECVRKVDTLARYGGEEFVVLMPQTGADGSLRQAERLCRLIAKHRFEKLPGDVRVTVSVGVATFDEGAMSKAEDLLRAADDAAYAAKRDGKNRVVAHPREKRDA